MVIKFYHQDTLETIIYADYKTKKIRIENHTDDCIRLAFGKNENPTWEDFENFLEERCVPRQRANIKDILEFLDVLFYDPISIIEKTQGRMAEDNAWMDIDFEEER